MSKKKPHNAFYVLRQVDVLIHIFEVISVVIDTTIINGTTVEIDDEFLLIKEEDIQQVLKRISKLYADNIDKIN